MAGAVKDDFGPEVARQRHGAGLGGEIDQIEDEMGAGDAALVDTVELARAQEREPARRREATENGATKVPT